MVSDTDPAEWIESTARSHPRRLFLKTPTDRELSYASLRVQSGRLAAALMRRGVVSGDRVAVQVDKSVEAVLLYLACLRMGAVFRAHQHGEYTQRSRLFPAATRNHGSRSSARPYRALIEPHATHAGVHHVETLGAEGEGSLLALVRESDEDPDLPPNPGANSLAAIVYTSGTTGRSKGAMLSRANLASNAAALAEAWHFTSRDVLLHTLPLFHVHGLFAAINTVLASGSSLVLLSKFDAESALKRLPQVTRVHGRSHALHAAAAAHPLES